MLRHRPQGDMTQDAHILRLGSLPHGAQVLIDRAASQVPFLREFGDLKAEWRVSSQCLAQLAAPLVYGTVKFAF